MTEPINPITVKGTRPGDSHERNLSVGRIWLGTSEASEGQNRFNPTKNTWDKTMQLVVWESTTDILAFVVVDENDFILMIRALRTKPCSKSIFGTPVRKENTAREVLFNRFGADLLVTIFDKKSDGPFLAQVYLDWDYFNKGLEHLFVKNELVLGDN